MHRLASALVVMAFIACPDREASAQGRPKVSIVGWGEAVDPDNDCQIRTERGELRISVPGTKHDLCSEINEMNAPRVLRKIDGDFIAQAKVSGNVQHTGNRTSQRSLAYHGAGLLLWKDDQNYIRLERAGIVRQDDRVLHYAHIQLRLNGRVVGNHSIQIADQDTFLRLERRGSRIYGLTSADGLHWNSLEPFEPDFPWELKLGFTAISTSTDPLKVSFSELEVFKAEAKSL
jgi:regulation of enolase protein 1 (concanavalin A-like superfamily)